MLRAVTGLVYRTLTNLIKPIFGKDKFNLQQDKFIVLYIKHLLSFKKKPLYFKITSSPRAYEGAGSQALRAMYAISFSTVYGLPYVHSKFSRLAHSDRPMDEWNRAWERYFNIGSGESVVNNDQYEVINLPESFHQIQYVFKINDFSELVPQTLDMIKAKYYLNKHMSINESNKLRVCIHIRAGDVSQTTNSQFWTQPQVLLNCIKQLVSTLEHKSLDYELHLFSQGKIEDFSIFEEMEIHFHLNEDPIWSHQQLVNADIFVMAKSTYSYVAALLGDGIMLYEPNEIPYAMTPLAPWLIRSTDGTFNDAEFEKALAQKLPKLKIIHDEN